jgi:excisionase family DNA binding protein
MESLTVRCDIKEWPDILTAKQVGAYLQVHPDHVYRLVARGDLPGIKVGGSVRIVKAKLLKFLER